MARRQLGHGRGGRMKTSATPRARRGRHGRTLGGRSHCWCQRDYANGRSDINPWRGSRRARGAPERPGHATGRCRSSDSHVSNVLERARARETAAASQARARKAFCARSSRWSLTHADRLGPRPSTRLSRGLPPSSLAGALLDAEPRTRLSGDQRLESARVSGGFRGRASARCRAGPTSPAVAARRALGQAMLRSRR